MARSRLDEYRERLELLGGDPGGSTRLHWVAASLVLVGLLGLVWLASAMNGAGMMSRMMDGPMMGWDMMGGMDARSGRIGPHPSPGAPQLRVEGGDLYFSPDELGVRAGQITNLTFANEGELFHTLTVPDAGIDLRAPPGEQVTAAFQLQEPGRYEMFCRLPGHAAGGMRDVIVVEAQA